MNGFEAMAETALLSGKATDYNKLMSLVGDARFVLIGEAHMEATRIARETYPFGV
jgi:hypothetical protein